MHVINEAPLHSAPLIQLINTNPWKVIPAFVETCRTLSRVDIEEGIDWLIEIQIPQEVRNHIGNILTAKPIGKRGRPYLHIQGEFRCNLCSAKCYRLLLEFFDDFEKRHTPLPAGLDTTPALLAAGLVAKFVRGGSIDGRRVQNIVSGCPLDDLLPDYPDLFDTLEIWTNNK